MTGDVGLFEKERVCARRREPRSGRGNLRPACCDPGGPLQVAVAAVASLIAMTMIGDHDDQPLLVGALRAPGRRW